MKLFFYSSFFYLTEFSTFSAAMYNVYFFATKSHKSTAKNCTTLKFKVWDEIHCLSSKELSIKNALYADFKFSLAGSSLTLSSCVLNTELPLSWWELSLHFEEIVCMYDILWRMFVIHIFQKICMNCLLHICYINVKKVVVCN